MSQRPTHVNTYSRCSYIRSRHLSLHRRIRSAPYIDSRYSAIELFDWFGFLVYSPLVSFFRLLSPRWGHLPLWPSRTHLFFVPTVTYPGHFLGVFCLGFQFHFFVSFFNISPCVVARLGRPAFFFSGLFPLRCILNNERHEWLETFVPVWSMLPGGVDLVLLTSLHTVFYYLFDSRPEYCVFCANRDWLPWIVLDS